MDIALLLLLHKALMGVQSQPPKAPDLFGRSKRPCPKPASAEYQIPLTDVKKFKELGIPIPIKGHTPTMAQPVEGAVTFGEALTNLMYPEGWDASQVVVNLDPADVAAFKEQEKIKRALR